jgi:peptidoglycan/xylan/chitin deacetylase (PgdA/CDA1 family)
MQRKKATFGRILKSKRKQKGGKKMTKKCRQYGAALFAAAFLLALGAPIIGAGASPAIPADGAGPGIVAAPPDVGQGTGGAKLIALTFDDGPCRSTTTRLLNGLAERGVRATFFLIGKNVEVNRPLVMRLESEGHQVGIHTYDHRQPLLGLNHADFSAQVDRTRNLLTEILGHSDFAFRPPYGLIDAGVKKWAQAPIILWSIDPEDWGDKNAEREAVLIAKEARDGDIILMHDIFDPTVEAALQVVDLLHAQGYYFVTINELFDERQIPLEKGQTYLYAYP